MFMPRPDQLPKHEDREMVEYYLDSKGVRRFKGGRHLKSSQSYPRWSLVFSLGI